MNLFYSWFSPEEDQPELVKKCIASWNKYLVPMGFKLINMNREYMRDNHLNENVYLNVCLSQNLFAHASDYLRFHAMYTFGGLYLDSDVECLGPIEDLLQLDVYIAREGNKSSIPDEPEAAILWFKNPNNIRLKYLLQAYDNLPIKEMTYKQIKLNTAPRMMLKSGMNVTSISHPNLVHRFNNTWFDYDVWNKDGIDVGLVNEKWKFVNELTRETRYVLTNKKTDFGEYCNLSIEEYGLDYIKSKLR
jgi:mannosyltransferase OCH1-like enzyme